jgi:hypothetical protein
LKKSFELEDSFRSLNHIPRSQTQKRKTYIHIMQTSKPKKQFNNLFGNWTGVFLTFVMVLFCSAFLYSQIINPVHSQQSAMKPAELVAAGEVVLTYLAKSDSDHYFSLNSNLTRKGVVIIEDPAWRKTIQEALNSRTVVSQVPAAEKEFDLLIVFEGSKSAKYKLSISGDEVFIKQFSDKEIYKISANQASLIINSIKDMEKQVHF